jgi:hypothetical protein
VTVTGAGSGRYGHRDARPRRQPGWYRSPRSSIASARWPSSTARAPTYADAVEYRSDYGSQRISIVDPGVLSWDTENSVYVQKPASAYAAGIQARIDEEKGFWYSFSNELIQNIGGPARPVDFMPNDRDCEANQLNSQQITTIIHDDGFRFWGLRNTGTDPLWAQLSVRRTADMIYESLERAERVRLDKPFSYQLLSGIQGDVNAYLRLLRSRGALIGGKCWIDPAINTPATFAGGELTVDFDLEPPACLEHLQFRAVRNPNYYTDFIESSRGSSQRLSASLQHHPNKMSQSEAARGPSRVCSGMAGEINANNNLRDSNIFQDFTVWINDVGKIGECPELPAARDQHPDEEFRGGGMDGTVEIPMGIEKIEFDFELHTWDQAIWTDLGYGPARSMCRSGSAATC